MNEWKEYKLGEVTSVLGDGIHGTPKYDDEGPIYFINGNNLEDGHIVLKETTKRVSYEEASKHSKPLCNRTILVSINGTIGNVAKYNGEPCILGKSACYFNVNENVDLDFIYYVVANNNFKDTITHLSTGTTIKNVSLKTMREYSFMLPSLPTQQKIANILSSLDKKIEANRRINDNLEQQAQALYKQWFVDFEFPNEEGNPYKSSGGKMIKSEMGEIPEKWHVGALKDIANVIMGQSPNGKSFNENSEGIVFYQGRTEFGSRYPSIRLYTTEPTRFAEPMSVLLSVRAPVGDINIATQRCCIGRGVASIDSKTGDNSYMYCCLKELRPQLDQYNGEGTVFGSINRKELEGLPLCIPNAKVIHEFNNLITGIEKQMFNLYQECSNLTTLRDTLLPRLMSGELSVNDVLVD